MVKNSILVIDDEKANIITLNHILSTEYTIYAAKNGQDGIELAKKYSPDVILLDIRMPEMDGYEVFSVLKDSEKTRDIPILFVTALSKAGDEERGLALGAADYIIKPFSPAVVKLRVKNQIRIIEQQLTEYDLMKHRLTSEALHIALWDMEVVSTDPVDPNNKFTWSQEFRHMLGFSDENDFPNLLHSWSDRLHPNDKERVLEAFSAHINDITGKTPYDIECYLMLKTGEYRYFHTFGATLRDSAGFPLRVAGALMDITEKKQTADALEELLHKLKSAVEQATAANRAKSNFLSNISHEMRTPMNAIIGMTNIAMKAEDKERKNQALKKIEDASAHLLGIINDVLDMSNIEASKLELNPAEFDFEQMLKNAVAIVNFPLDEKRQRLKVVIDKNIPRFLVGDEQRLAQVITNLLFNAVKFTPEEGNICLEALFAEETDGNCEFRFEVTDDGIGISKEQQENVFYAFEQVESGTSREYGGTGLGLVISKRIVELMGGSIWVESELGEGSRFIFTVKLRRGSSNPQDEHTDCEFAGKHLLVAEDIAINREILITLLEDTGLLIDCAENGKEALNMIAAAPEKYHIVFMDMQMPVMDGLESTRRIRALPSHRREKLPIVAMTANIFQDDVASCHAAGMDGHLGKPLDIDAVFEVLHKHLGK